MRCSGIYGLLLTNVSGRPIDPIFKGREIQEESSVRNDPEEQISPASRQKLEITGLLLRPQQALSR
jgi:hypothetical protein